MTDEFAIQETINRYSEGASRADWDQVLSTYLPNGVWEIPDLKAKFEGHKALREGLMHFAGPMDYIVQLNSPALIKLDGDKGKLCIPRNSKRRRLNFHPSTVRTSSSA